MEKGLRLLPSFKGLSMFTCAKIRDGSTYLGSHLSANDYYCKNEHVTAVWMGKGAELLSPAGKSVEKGDEAFEALRRNLMPDGPHGRHGRDRYGPKFILGAGKPGLNERSSPSGSYAPGQGPFSAFA
jgi:hypothetical protein